ncbi:MAG: alpha/beta fold hydrolase [Myxococcota bacterium]
MAEPRERWARANGLHHHVIEWGQPDAPTVVLCHGFLDVGFSFDRVGRRLAEGGYRAVAFDFRGHGETDWVATGGYYHFPDYTLDLHELLPQVADGPVHLLGHSMGGTVACMYAGTVPERVRTLTLVEGLGPPAFPTDQTPDKFRTWFDTVKRARTREPRTMPDLDAAVARMRMQNPDLSAELGRFLASKATRPAEDGSGRLWRFDPLHRSTSPLPFRLDMFRTFLSRIEAPVLVLAGANGFRLEDEGQRLAWIGDARFVELPDVGHMIHWFAPDTLSDHLLGFLTNLPG